MPDADETARRRELKKAYLRCENLRAWEKMYLSQSQFESLLEYLEAKLEETGCYQTLGYTRQWARSHGVNPDTLSDNIIDVWGQGCDCEVFNIADELRLL